MMNWTNIGYVHISETSSSGKQHTGNFCLGSVDRWREGELKKKKKEKHLKDFSSCNDQTCPNYSPFLPLPYSQPSLPLPIRCCNLAQQDHKEKIKLKQANYWAIY